MESLDLAVSLASDVFKHDTSIVFCFLGKQMNFPLTVKPWMLHLLGVGRLALYIGTIPGFTSKDCAFETVPTEQLKDRSTAEDSMEGRRKQSESNTMQMTERQNGVVGYR
jgi:hypothetical protein